MPTPLDRYREHADRLGQRFLDLRPEQVLASVADYLPKGQAKIVDIGAGSGRDALWFAQQGHDVTAIEPVPEIAAKAQGRPGNDQVEWLTDSLPDLVSMTTREGIYDLALLSGVWHHIRETERPAALRSIWRLLTSNGRLILSLRLGADHDNQTLFPLDTKTTLTQANAAGFRLLHQASSPSIQTANIAADVTWDWLVFEKMEKVK